MKISHSPGEFFVEVLNAPGRAMIRSRDGTAVYDVASCDAHNADLLALARHAPHDCNHEGCPGRENAARLARLEILNLKARALREVVTGTLYAELVRALGEARAAALWSRLAELQAAENPAVPADTTSAVTRSKEIIE